MAGFKLIVCVASGVAAASFLIGSAWAWGPHPEVDAARAHLLASIDELARVEKANPPGSFGGHVGKAIALERQALEEFDRGIEDRSKLP